MSNIEADIYNLYKRIFGNKVITLNYDKTPKEIVKETSPNDKCTICNNDTCSSFKYRQDLPYFKNLNNIETLVIAEAPGTGAEEGKLGYAFGWNQFNNNNSNSINIKKYENYFFEVLGLSRDKTYITDALKCYTNKKDFNNVFFNCKSYLKDEINILKPKKVLVISKQNSLKKFLLELNKPIKKFELQIIPHPSNQNISKIKTVSEIFKSLGLINNNKDLEELGIKIEEEYSNLIKKLKQ